MAQEPTATAQRAPIRRQPRPGVHPTGGVSAESPEVPTPDEVQPKPADSGGFEPPAMETPAPATEPERPPGPAVMWQRFRDVETKVEVLWLARQNQARRPVGTAEWACAFEIQPGVKCGKRTISTPPGQPKVPPLSCPDHGQSPHDLVE